MGCMFNGNAHLLYGKKQSKGLAGIPWLKFHWILYNETALMSPCRQVLLELLQWFDMNSAVIAEQQSNPLYKIQSTCCVTAQSVHFTVCFPIEASSTYRFCSSVCSLACSLRALVACPYVSLACSSTMCSTIGSTCFVPENESKTSNLRPARFPPK